MTGIAPPFLPVRFTSLLKEPYDLFLEAAVGLLMGETTVASLQGSGQHTGSGFLASPIEQPVSVEAVVQGDHNQADLLVRSLDGDRADFAVPMQRASYDGEETVFESEFQPEESERYMLTLGLYDEDGRWLLNSGQLGIVGYRGETDVLAMFPRNSDSWAPAMEELVSAVIAGQVPFSVETEHRLG